MSTSTRKYPTFECEVCGTRTRFHHLDAKLCSACASFYRRAIRENLRFKCAGDEKCLSGRGKFACRACRFNKCQELGAKLPPSSQSQPNLDISTPSPPAINSQTVIKIQEKSDKYPILSQLVTGYELFLKAQHTIVSLMYPELQFSQNRIITNRKLEKAKISGKSIALLMDMFNVYFGPFRELDVDVKKKVLVESLGDYEIFCCIYLTVTYFPEPNDSRIMDTIATYFDMDPAFTSFYYDGFVKPEELQNYLNFMAYPMKKMVEHINKFRKIGFRKEDTVVLMLLSLYKKVEQDGLITKEMVEFREKMLNELAQNLCDCYGAVDGPQKMTNLMHLFFENDNMTQKLKGYVLVTQVRMNKNKEDLLCGLSDFMKELKINLDARD